MNLATTLLTCSDTYCQARKIARPTLSGLVFKDSRTLDRVANGGSLTIRSFEDCMVWLSKNWPVDTAWPEGVDRPEIAGRDAEVRAPAPERTAA